MQESRREQCAIWQKHLFLVEQNRSTVVGSIRKLTDGREGERHHGESWWWIVQHALFSEQTLWFYRELESKEEEKIELKNTVHEEGLTKECNWEDFEHPVDHSQGNY